MTTRDIQEQLLAIYPSVSPDSTARSCRDLAPLVLLLPVWLFILAAVVSALLVLGRFCAPGSADDLEQAPDDDSLPDDYVPPFVPRRRS